MIAGYVLDAGFFVGLERRNARAVRLLQRIRSAKVRLVTPAGVVAQIWRGGRGSQHPIAVLLPDVGVVDLTRSVAQMVGMVLALTGTNDPVDAHVALIAQELDWPVITSAPDDLRALDASLELVII